MSKCSRTRADLSEMDNRIDFLTKLGDEKLEQMYPGFKDMNKKAEKTLAEGPKKYNSVNNNLVPEDDLDEALADNGLNEKEIVISKILFIKKQNPLLMKHMGPLILSALKRRYKPKTGVKITQPPQTFKGQLEQASLGVLKDIFADMVNFDRIMQGTDPSVFGRGKVGEFLIAYKTPEKLGLLEPTGAILKHSKDMNNYARNIATNIEDHWSDDPAGKRKGIESIITEVSILDDTYTSEDYIKEDFGFKNMEQRKVQFFSLASRGIIKKIDGVWQIATVYDTKLKKDSKNELDIETYESTGDPMYQLQDYVPVSDFKDGAFDIPLTETSWDRLEELITEYRDLNKDVNEKVVKDFDTSVKRLTLNFNKLFPELSNLIIDVEVTDFETFETHIEQQSAANIILYGKDKKAKAEAIKKARKVLANVPTSLKKFDLLLDKTNGFITDTRYFADMDNLAENNLGEVEEYFPVIYPDYHVPRRFQTIKEELDAKILNEQDPKKKARLEKRLDHIKEVIDSIRNAAVDDNGDKIIFQSTSKHFIHYSGAVDIREMRTDKTVYYDYLRKQFSKIERNNLTANIMETLMMTDEDATIDYIFDHYSVPFNNRSLKTRTGLGVDLDPTSDKNPLGDVDDTDFYTGLASAYLTWGYLGKPTTGIVNMSAIAQNIYKYSWQETVEQLSKAWDLEKDDSPRGKALRAIIKRSGITNFSNFFGEAMVDRIAGTMLEQQTHLEILDVMIRYISESRSSKGRKSKLKKEMHAEIEKILIESGRFTEADDFKPSPDISKEELEGFERDKELVLRERLKSTASAFVQYAINKRVPILNHIRDLEKNDPNFKSAVRASIKGGTAISRIWATVPFVRQMSMGETEKLIRIVPFLIGLQRAIDEGEFIGPGNNYHLYTEKQIRKAINIGADFSDKTNYALSTTGLGASFWGPFGRVFGKFVGWSNQKWQDDYENIRALYRFHTPHEKISKGEVDFDSLFKVFLEANTLGIHGIITEGKKRKLGFWDIGVDEHDYRTYEVRKFLLMQGLTTIISTQLFYGSGGIGKLVGKLTGFSSFKVPSTAKRVAGGGSSDLLFFMQLPLNIAIGYLVKMFFDDDEDEKKRRDSMVRNILWHLPLGVLPNWGLERTLDLFDWTQGLITGRNWMRNATSPMLKGADPLGIFF